MCAAPGSIELLAGNEVQVGSVGVALEQRPVVACDQGHRTTPQQVVRAAMGAVEDAVVQARSRLLRGDVCRACSTALTMPVRRTTRSVSVEAGTDRPVLTLHFDLPSTRCPECSVEQVPSRSQEDLVVSVPAVFSPPAE